MYVKDEDKNLVAIPPEYKQIFENKFTINIGKNEIIKMKNNNVITDRDLKIAKFLFLFKFATCNQLYEMFGNTTSKMNFKNRLDKLVKYRVLNKFMLSDKEEEQIFPDALEFYCLDLGGRYLLSHYSNEDTSDWYTAFNMKSSEIVYKNLVVTNFFIRLMQTIPAKISYFKAEPELRVGKKNVIPSFEMCMIVNGKNRYFIGEVVRHFDLPLYFRDRALKLESLLTTNAWKKYYYDSDRPPILFVFADTDKTALEAGKILAETTEIENFRLTTDERMQRKLSDVGAFLRYLKDQEVLQEIRAITFEP